MEFRFKTIAPLKRNASIFRKHFGAAIVAWLFLFAAAPLCKASEPDLNSAVAPAEISTEASLPDAPVPQIALLASSDAQADHSSDAASSDSSSQSSAASPSQHDKAETQIKQQEKQRVAGILPSFNVTYDSNAASMTARQKIKLAFRSSTDYFPFGLAFLVGGIHEVGGDTDFGWGPEGYFKRVGAAYLDSFDGNMIGNGFLPALLHQDPRYFRLGHGTMRHRILYAMASSYMCKHDNTHRWEPNYSNVGGNIIAGAISNLYYPSEDSGWGQTLSNGLVVTAEGTLGGVLSEFWPDVSRKLFHKDPTQGRDAELRAEDRRKRDGGDQAPEAPQQ